MTVEVPGLEHRIEMQARGRGILTWSLAIRWLHDAAVEDVLTQAQRALGLPAQVVPWSRYVRVLMWLMSSRRPSTAALVRS